MDLFDILSNDERVVVLSDADEGMIYTWNKSLTLQSWWANEDKEWIEVDVQTLSTRPKDFDSARNAALRWYSAKVSA
jgi:hypothetical protein